MTMLYATHDPTIGAQIQGQVIPDLRFADEIVLIAENAKDLQTIVKQVFQLSTINLELKINPRPSEVFFCNTSSKGGCCKPSLDFLYGTPDTPILLPVYRCGPPLSIDTKVSTIGLHMTSL